MHGMYVKIIVVVYVWFSRWWGIFTSCVAVDIT